MKTIEIHTSNNGLKDIIYAVDDSLTRAEEILRNHYKDKDGTVGRIKVCKACGGQQKVRGVMPYETWYKNHALYIKRLKSLLQQLRKIYGTKG